MNHVNHCLILTQNMTKIRSILIRYNRIRISKLNKRQNRTKLYMEKLMKIEKNLLEFYINNLYKINNEFYCM